ncbi:hypothetical protein [Hymenobacter sp. UYCo722]|uniref:hypothetical protein n=1 Tax=Hymenobacter sp. UYCo722 TaxID=3156335 RepID=UPI003390C8E2
METKLRAKRWWPATHTGYVWLCIAFIFVAAIGRGARWKKDDVLISDTVGYYAYLPGAFITHDLGDGTYQQAIRAQYRPDLAADYGMVHLPNDRTVFKYPLGMAVAYAPWFALAHAYASVPGGPPADGYSLPYQVLLPLGCMLYALLGLWLLGRELRRYFPDYITALTLLCIGLGTNLFTYATHEATMSHATLFLLNVLLLRNTRAWYEQGRWSTALALAAGFGLQLLVRPSELMLAAVPLLWGLTNGAAVRQRLAEWLARWPQLLSMVALVAAIAGLQFLFWRVVGGSWVLDFYPGEKFDFRHPHLLDGLFSVRKGWLFWTPLMGLALLGIAWTRRAVPAALPPLLVLVPVMVYVTFSWWDWVYGGGFSARPLISLYPLLSLALASFWARWWPGFAWPLAVLVLLLVLLNLAQGWQYYLGIVNSYNETWKQYTYYFFDLEWPNPNQ